MELKSNQVSPHVVAHVAWLVCCQQRLKSDKETDFAGQTSVSVVMIILRYISQTIWYASFNH